MTEMLDFLKAMSSADRLRIVGLLTRKRASRAEITAQLDLPLREVVDHLAFLEHVGVISLMGDVYELNPDELSMLARDQFSQEHPAYVLAPDLDETSRKMLRTYLKRDECINHIPNQPDKLRVILTYLLQAFGPGNDYTEREVNDILRRFNADTARLRRDLVDAGLLPPRERRVALLACGGRHVMSEELLTFFKALSDANRIKIVGLLSHQPYSVEELAAILNLKSSTVSHHLAKLAQVGLVSAKAEGYYSVYQLDEKALEEKSKCLFSQENLTASVADVDANAYDRKVLAGFTRRDGSLKTIPAQRKKLDAVLRYVVRDFEPGKKYSEKKVNEILRRYHDDTASLRRELVSSGLMKREGGGGDYWRTGD